MTLNNNLKKYFFLTRSPIGQHFLVCNTIPNTCPNHRLFINNLLLDTGDDEETGSLLVERRSHWLQYFPNCLLLFVVAQGKFNAF
jgi:hypothetical protein